MKRIISLFLFLLILAVSACAEEYEPAAPLTEWGSADLDGSWKIFYRIDGGEGKSTEGSPFQISLVIDGENLTNTFTYPDGENVTECTVKFTEEGTFIDYGDYLGEVQLLEDGTLQVHIEATDVIMDTVMFYAKD
ncbi:MAG: hypothetical protein IJH78_06415 [Clostridia bacterium]|nr:hypothetical protein [Clostridia bacterium]